MGQPFKYLPLKIEENFSASLAVTSLGSAGHPWASAQL